MDLALQFIDRGFGLFKYLSLKILGLFIGRKKFVNKWYKYQENNKSQLLLALTRGLA